MPKLLGKAAHLSMRKAAEVVVGELSDRVAPSATLVELVMEQIEETHLEAVPLNRVTAAEDNDDMRTGATIDSGGVVRIRRGRQDVTEPSDPEQLRRRLRTLGIAYLYAKLKHPGRAWLQSASPELFADYVDYLLGEHVRGLEAQDQSGNTVSRPAWKQILHYEFQIRKEHAKLVNNGSTFRDALRQAWLDTSIRDRHFITPIAVSGASGAGVRDRSPRRQPFYHQSGRPEKGKGKGKQKGKGKGKGKWHARAPDGRLICFAFNNPNERCNNQCRMVHVCRRCFGRHPVHSCPQRGGGAPQEPAATAGAAPSAD